MFCKSIAFKQKTVTLNQFDTLDQKIAEILSESDLYLLETTTTLKDYIHKRLTIFNLGLYKEGKTFLDKQKNGLFFNVWWMLCFKQTGEFEFSLQSKQGESAHLCKKLVHFIYKNTNGFENSLPVFQSYLKDECKNNDKVEFFFETLTDASIDTRRQQKAFFDKTFLNTKSEIILSKILNMGSTIFHEEIWAKIPLKLCIDVKDFNELLRQSIDYLNIHQEVSAVFFIPTSLVVNILAAKSPKMLKFSLKYNQYLHRPELLRDVIKMQAFAIAL